MLSDLFFLLVGFALGAVVTALGTAFALLSGDDDHPREDYF